MKQYQLQLNKLRLRERSWLVRGDQNSSSKFNSSIQAHFNCGTSRQSTVALNYVRSFGQAFIKSVSVPGID